MRFLAAALCLPLLFAANAGADSLVRPNDRIAICGDPLTASPGYTIYIEDYLLMSRQIPGLDVSNFGWSAPTPDAFKARLRTDLVPYKPSIVLTDFGLAGDPEDYRKVQTALVDSLKQAGVRVIVVGSPKCVDATGYRHDPSQAAAENKHRAALAEIDREVAAKEGVLYADVYGATFAAMSKAKARLGQEYPFDQDPDGMRPTDGCNLAMAYAFLKALGFDGQIDRADVDFAARTATASPNQKVLSFQDQKLTLQATLHPVWFPGYPSGRPRDLIVKFIPFDDELNRFDLTVKNLPTARTKIRWADEEYDYSSADLAAGVNLMDEMEGRAFAGVNQDVDNAVRDQQQAESQAGYALLRGNPDPQAAAKRDAAIQLIHTRLRPFTSTIEIQPLAAVAPQPTGPIPVIVDTDMDGDVDDVGALALVNDFMDRGEATLLACVTNTINTELSSGATAHAIDSYYGHASVPIGCYHGEPGPNTHMTSVLLPAPPNAYHGVPSPISSHYTLAVHRQFDPDFPNDDRLPAGVDIYRKILASAPDGSVVIASIGLMENIQDLIQSQPDSVSPLSGMELVRKKVRELVIMANTVDQDEYLLGKWPTKILWTTFVGTTIYAGTSLAATPESNPVRLAYKLFGDGNYTALKNGRQCWDLTAAWLAVRGPGDLWDVIPGYWHVDHPQRYGHWVNTLDTRQGLIILRMPSAEVGKLIDAELSRPPRY